MDLIYTDTGRQDLGVLKDFYLDMAFGGDENNFKIETDTLLEGGSFLYVENEEYGGIIDKIYSSREGVKYTGRTFHGVLNSKCIIPLQPREKVPGSISADFTRVNQHLVVTGDASDIVRWMLARLELKSIFSCEGNSGIWVNGYQFARYVMGYDGIVSMLKAYGAKLKFSFEDGHVKIVIEPIVDYSADESFNSDIMNLDVAKEFSFPNHMICLGAGELEEREVIHLYATADRRISATQHFYGVYERTIVYENSGGELRANAIKKFREILSKESEIKTSLYAHEESYDIGDIVGGKDEVTGIGAKCRINKKVLKMRFDTMTVDYVTEVV